MDRKQHWEQAYPTKGQTEVSWFQVDPTTSFRLLDTAALSAAS